MLSQKSDFCARAEEARAAFQCLGSMLCRQFWPEGIFAQNLAGVAKNTPTSHDLLPLGGCTPAYWTRNGHKLDTWTGQVCSLGFLMDGSLSFSPPIHNSLFVGDVGACSPWYPHHRVAGVIVENHRVIVGLQQQGCHEFIRTDKRSDFGSSQHVVSPVTHDSVA